MCSSPSPPAPQAPPAPIPVRDAKMDAMRSRQGAARRASATGYDSTVLTQPGGVLGQAQTASPVLGA